jgi:hypothetical protein
MSVKWIIVNWLALSGVLAVCGLTHIADPLTYQWWMLVLTLAALAALAALAFATRNTDRPLP